MLDLRTTLILNDVTANFCDLDSISLIICILWLLLIIMVHLFFLIFQYFLLRVLPQNSDIDSPACITLTISVIEPIEEIRNPCNPSPCGANSICKEQNGAGSCTCLPDYFGDPYTGCRPECVTNSDCPRERACTGNKCIDPCPGTCGINAECFVANHAPSCNCLPGYTGNPLSSCQLIPQSKI